MGVLKTRGCKICGGNVLLDLNDTDKYTFCLRCGAVAHEEFETRPQPLSTGQRVEKQVALAGKH